MEDEKEEFTNQENFPFEISSLVEIADIESYENRKIKTRKKTNIALKKINNSNSSKSEFTSQDIEQIEFQYLKKGFDKTVILTIAKQLGYIPITLVDVAYYHETDHRPIVLQLYPLNYTEMPIDRKSKTGEKERVKLPFPTLFWLSCPEAFSKIAKLEHDGWIPILQEKLLKDEEALLLMKGAHEEYAKERWDLLSEDDKAFVEGQSWVSKVRDVGVAGISNFQSIKCFHCHYAHSVARPEHNNIVGKWVQELLTQENLSI